MRFHALILLLAACFSLHAENFSGKWAMPAGGRGGSVIFVLNQVGNDVYGTVTPPGDPGTGAPRTQEILDGKVSGGVITFYIWTGNDVPAKQMYKGVMSDDQITFEITGGAGRRGGGRGPANTAPPVAKRVK
jgi:hypothetical protein